MEMNINGDETKNDEDDDDDSNMVSNQLNQHGATNYLIKPATLGGDAVTLKGVAIMEKKSTEEGRVKYRNKTKGKILFKNVETIVIENPTKTENEAIQRRSLDVEVDAVHRRLALNKKKSVRENFNVETENLNKETEEINNEETERLPDGGWGWVVVFGASLILILVDVVGQCFGIIFSRMLLSLDTPTTMTAWIFNLFSFIWCMTGPPLGPLISEFGWRTLAFVGSILLTTATVTSAFVKAAWVLFFTYSLLAGLGCGIISNISYMIVPHYFNKRRGLANGIIMAFDCGGQLIGSPLIQILQDEYTYKGATLILGGLVLNCCVGAAVFQPVKWHLKPKNTATSKNEETRELIQNSDELTLDQKVNQVIHSDSSQTHCSKSQSEVPGNVLDKQCNDVIDSTFVNLSSNNKQDTSSRENHREISLENQCLNPDDINLKSSKKQQENLWTRCLRLFKSTINDLVILKSAKALIIAVAATFIFNGYLNFLALVPFSMQENGYTLEDAATCVSVSAICNMITRVIIAALSDSKWFNFRISMLVGSLTISGTMVCFTFLDDLTMIRFTMGLWGFGVGNFMSIFNLVMVHYMGLNNLMQMMGASMLCIAVGYLSIGPFAGYIRDVTDSYDACIWLLAAVVFSSFILWIFMPSAVAYDHRQQRKARNNVIIKT